MQHLFRRPFLVFVMCMASLPAFAATVDGFVTGIDSGTTLEVGRLQIVLNQNTSCERGTTYGLKIIPARGYGGQPQIRYLLRPHLYLRLDSMRAKKIECDTRLIAIGTRIHVSGELEASNKISAEKLIGYTAPLEHSVGGGQFPSHPSARSERKTPKHTAQQTEASGDSNQTMPRSINFGYGEPIPVIQSQAAQNSVSEVGERIVKSYENDSPTSKRHKIHFRFYIIQSSHALIQKKMLTIDGALPYISDTWGQSLYTYKRLAFYKTAADNSIATEDGLVLVPDTVLCRLRNQAQLAALLSYSIASVMGSYILPASLAVESDSSDVQLHRFSYMLQLNERVLGMGIRHMYLAGYDIREAPFAWTVAQGKPAINPVIDSKRPDRQFPWYAVYGFNYISNHYQNADYRTLKRGEKEFGQLLDELYKADPALGPSKLRRSAQ